MEHAPHLTHAGPDPESALSDAERRAAMEALVAQLPPKLRLPVQLCYLNGMTQRDVATALGLPLSTLHSRLKAALNRLRPLAERAGLRDTLGILAAGALSGGLMIPPGGLTAGVVVGAKVGAGVAMVVLGGWSLFAWSGAAKITAMAAVVLAVAVAALTVGSELNASRTSHQPVPRIEVASAVDPEASNGGSTIPESVAVPAAAARVDDNEIADAPSPRSRELSQPTLELDPENETQNDEEEQGVESRFITVVVTEKRTGEPISGVSVGINNQSVNPFESIARGITSSEGIVRFENVPVVRIGVGVGASKWVSKNLTMNIEDGDPVVEFQLEPSGTLIVKVRDEKGAPIQRTSVMIQNDPRGSFGGTSVDESGTLRWSNTVKGRPVHYVSVFHRDYERVELNKEVTIPLESDEHVVEIVMKPGSELQSKEPLIGRVVDARTKRPIANALVESRSGNPPISKKTGIDGEFHFEFSEKIAWTLEDSFTVTAEGYAPKGFYVGKEARDSISVELMRGLSTSGIVVDESGAVLPEVKVTATVDGGFVVAETVTDHRGFYQLDGLDEETDLTYRASKRITRPGHNLVGKNAEVILLEKAFPLFGQVVDGQSSEPIQQFTIEILPTQNRLPEDRYIAHRTWRYLGPTLIDSDTGTFSQGEFPRDFVLSLSITANGYQPTTIDRVIVDPDGEPIVVEMRR